MPQVVAEENFRYATDEKMRKGKKLQTRLVVILFCFFLHFLSVLSSKTVPVEDPQWNE